MNSFGRLQSKAYPAAKHCSKAQNFIACSSEAPDASKHTKHVMLNYEKVLENRCVKHANILQLI